MKRPSSTLVLDAALKPVMARCEETLRDAVASRNGSIRDGRGHLVYT